ncbi:MAG: ABC transporter permease [Methanobacteriaceae archaeon]|nr:ABC transporter permease [Methanobacteriaceae archaeon]
MIVLGILIQIPLSIYGLFYTLILMILITVGLTCIGLIIVSLMSDLEIFGTIVTFVNMAMFFLSGALFPITNLSSWNQWASISIP